MESTKAKRLVRKIKEGHKPKPETMFKHGLITEPTDEKKWECISKIIKNVQW